MDAEMKALFARYQRLFEKGLSGDVDAREIAAIYTPAFIAASPAGVFTGKNDDALLQVMKEGYARYRQAGMKSMRLGDIRLSVIDDLTAWLMSVGQPAMCAAGSLTWRSNSRCTT